MKQENIKGFTLIELLVAMGLFLAVIVLASGTFIRALKIERQAISLIAINDGANLALEQMAREIRTGSDFSSTGKEILSFTSAVSKQITYQFNANSKSIERSEDGVVFQSLTASNVLVNKLAFITSGLDNNDDLPVRITIVLSVGSHSKNLENIFTNLETTVSPRFF